jgi:hypothetical protein
MVAAAAFDNFNKKEFSSLELDVSPTTRCRR